MLSFLRGRPLHPAAVLITCLGWVGLLLWGLLSSPYPYADPHFVPELRGAELLILAWLAVCTFAFFPASDIGMRLPRLIHVRALWPVVILLLLTGSIWGAGRFLTQPTAASADIPPLKILMTTLLVGVTEEWVCRGILLAACVRWFGFRRGVLLSILLFGASHLLNLAGGQSWGAVGLQFVLTALIGASLALLAVGTRSILLPIFSHAMYDFFVVDSGRLAHTDLTTVLSATVYPVILLVGIYSLYCLMRLREAEPYPPLGAGSSS